MPQDANKEKTVSQTDEAHQEALAHIEMSEMHLGVSATSQMSEMHLGVPTSSHTDDIIHPGETTHSHTGGSYLDVPR